MSWKLTGIASKKRVGSTARKFLLVAMCDKANDDGTGVYASFGTLADMIEGSRPTVKRIVKEFLDEGLIRHVGMRACTNGATNEYDICVEALEALPEIGDKKPNPVHGEPGSQRTRSKANPHPVHDDPPTRVTMTPKPILKPIPEPFSLGVSEKPPVEAKAKRPRSTYSVAFEDFWKLWPQTWRERSDKRLAYQRWKADIEQWPIETIMEAARRHIARNKRDAYRYCGRADVFLNGKLEAAIEAVTAAPAERQEVWDAESKAWVRA